MKAKVAGNVVLVMHVVVLAGFSLMQGCKTAKAGGVSQDQPVILPAGDGSSAGIIPAGSSTPAVPAVSTAPKVCTVKKGDTLSSIASAHGTSWKRLAEYNNLSNPNELKVGQEIRIPDSVGSASSSAPAKRATPVSSRPIAGSIKQGGSYVIQKGDMLSSIAKRSGLTAAEIKAANSMTNDHITVGKKLTIPKKGEAKAASAAAKPAAAKSAAVKTVAPVKPAAPIPAPAPIADAAQSSVSSTGTAVVAAPAVPEAAPVAKSASAPVYEHVLYPGETLDDVARQYGSSQQEIMKLNNITDAASIKPGTKLLVPIPE